MVDIVKPSNLSLTWASGGDILNPGDTKYASGWAVEIPPRQWFNYLDNRQDEAIAHINQRGVAEWDAATEYQGTKSYAQGTTGTIYRSKQTSINQDPDADVGEVYWEIAFASAGDFYTKTETDNLYLAKASNLADLANTATARANLSVYSQAETYTQAAVDAKTTVASTAQAQAWTSNTTLITPLRLTDALRGANQNTSINGFQKLPGGLIIQWGRATASGTTIDVTFPTPFTALLFAMATDQGVSPSPPAYSQWDAASSSTTQARFIFNVDPVGLAYFAIGI
jgi:hypothetical protein